MTDHWRRLLPGIGRQLWRYKLRSGLVILCAALGVAGATTAVNYASGGREQVLNQIRRLGSNVLTISAEQSRGVADRARTGAIVTTLVPADYAAIRREIPGIVRSSARVFRVTAAEGRLSSKVAPVVGVEPAWFAMKSWELAEGSLYTDEDEKRSARVVVIGSTVARNSTAPTRPWASGSSSIACPSKWSA